MSESYITVQIEHPEFGPGPIRGFKFFWAYYVNGFDQTTHCQLCFKGSLSKQFNSHTVQSGRRYTMNELRTFRYLYICGVGVGPKSLLWRKNFHLPMEYRAGSHEVRQTYNGYVVTVENAVALPIPELEVGWKGLDLETTRCKNFRFAVGQFGWIDRPAADPVTHQESPMDILEPPSVPTILCPHCQQALSKEFLMQSTGRIISRLRKTARGRAKTYYACGCGFVESAAKFRAHRCPLKPPRRSEQAATQAQYEEYSASK